MCLLYFLDNREHDVILYLDFLSFDSVKRIYIQRIGNQTAQKI